MERTPPVGFPPSWLSCAHHFTSICEHFVTFFCSEHKKNVYVARRHTATEDPRPCQVAKPSHLYFVRVAQGDGWTLHRNKAVAQSRYEARKSLGLGTDPEQLALFWSLERAQLFDQLLRNFKLAPVE